MSSLSTDLFCAAISRNADAQLFGTATEASIWFLLEHTGTWKREAFAESDLPDTVKAHFNTALQALPQARLQLIKQDPPYDLPKITLAIAISREIDPALYVFEFDDHEAISALNLLDVVQNEAEYQNRRVDEPMVLICTNAKRDRCCALRGLPTYNQLVEIMGTSVWRTTHLGGHRNAATGLVLPHGIMYGRIDDTDLSEFAADILAKRIHLPALRGTSRYPAEVQAAEYFLRDETQIMQFEAFRLVSVESIGDDQWEVRFADVNGHAEYAIGVARTVSDTEIMPSCGKPSERMVEHHMLYHRVASLP